MKRIFKSLIVSSALVCIALTLLGLLAPHLLISMRDRSLRLLRNLSISSTEITTPAKLADRLASKGLRPGLPVFIRIMKESSELELWMERESQWHKFETYQICRWSGALGPKLREGDGQSPEGFYAVSQKALNPRSAYFLSFDLAFPNAHDRAHGRTGSFLMVHGDCVSIGCYAMTDAGIAEIYPLVEAALKQGQAQLPVHVFPFRMNESNMARHASSQWMPFWKALKDGWDIFETSGKPPLVRACGKDYRFGDAGQGPGCRDIAGM